MIRLLLISLLLLTSCAARRYTVSFTLPTPVYFGNWSARLRALAQECEEFPDTEADGVVFCGKCGKIK